MSSTTLIQEKITCFHCGDHCLSGLIHFDEKSFCCDGCRLVYEVLKDNNLCTYYQFNTTPGISPKSNNHRERFAYLDKDEVKNKLIQFTDGRITSVNFSIPQIHCSSCIWLLENLNRINKNIIRSRVNFLDREVNVAFAENEMKLREVVEMLSTIGYEPRIRLDDLEKKKIRPGRSRIYRIGVAGFAFGNIMLFSFPEYFSLADSSEAGFNSVFSYLNLALSIPVFFYCSSEFFISAFRSLKQKFLNIDVPIALGILVMFARSLFEIITRSGPGFMDTMAGLVFFMLIGRFFQDKTYRTLSFERDYKSFFPISVMCIRNEKEYSVPVSDINVGDHLVVRNDELIPADSVLVDGRACVDYSFVTGESIPQLKKIGEIIYAGGRQKGPAIGVKVVKKVSQSYLTQLWNDIAAKEDDKKDAFKLLVNRISHYFTMIILAVAITSLAYWYWKGNSWTGWNSFTAVLIIACPCALAISSPFTLGNILRIFGRNKFYLKNYSVIEKLAKADTIVFDKTGTLTKNNQAAVTFIGGNLSACEVQMIHSLVRQSTHPLSRLIYNSLESEELLEVTSFSELAGSGIEGSVSGISIKAGSAAYTGYNGSADHLSTRVYLVMNENYRGYFAIQNEYREGLISLVTSLKSDGYQLVVLSGDNESEKPYLKKIFGEETKMAFRLSPADKLNAINKLKSQGKTVLMIGDGLNDAGALRESDVGISISDDINNFSPACDAILDSSQFSRLHGILKTSKASSRIILASFIIALIYNVVGLWFAVQGLLSPVIAAVIMPISSVTIIAFTTGSSNLVAMASYQKPDESQSNH